MCIELFQCENENLSLKLCQYNSLFGNLMYNIPDFLILLQCKGVGLCALV